MFEEETKVLEEAAGEKLGVQRWDRPAIFREAASAATDNGLPFWLVLVLSGGIATLGLATNSAAVVIGAMLVAPLLAPIVGLALALAVGDGRLAVQTGMVVIGSTFAVVLISAFLTVLLPFQTITVEISARTQPTTLDLAIAVFSGLAGVVVTVARGSRLSAAIPGVAISVALIPPLAVAGFGIGAGWNQGLISGSLLLYGANLAGIVLSGMGVFLLVGMHRPDVLEAARTWHATEEQHGLSAWAARAPLIRSLGVFRSPFARVALVLFFVVALGFPLSESLSQIARETRVERAVGDAAGALFDVQGRASILSRQVVYGSGTINVFLRVATTEWFGSEDRQEFERRASAQAGEAVRLSLEQLPARGEDLEQLVALLPRREQAAASAPPPAVSLPELASSARLRLRQAAETLVAPSEITVVGFELVLPEGGSSRLRITYAATEPLQRQAEEMLRRQAQRSPELADFALELVFLSTAPVSLSGTPADSALLRTFAAGFVPRDNLVVELLASEFAGSQEVESARRGLVEQGIPAEHIRVSRAAVPGLQVRVATVSRSSPSE
jgi:uncharacterized hydrophobic protein (TIGR00271 family)